MQKVKLPKTLDPVRAAQQRSEFMGFYEIKDLKRLAQSCVSVDKNAAVSVCFDIDPLGRRFFTGEVSCMVTLECQRCGHTYEKAISTHFSFTPVKEVKQQDDNDEDEAVPDAYDPIELEPTGEIDLQSLIEDELILLVPTVPRHESENCPASSRKMTWGEIDEQAEKPNPFGALEQLKNQFKK